MILTHDMLAHVILRRRRRASARLGFGALAPGRIRGLARRWRAEVESPNE